MELISQFKELGIAGIAIAGFVYLCLKVLKELRESRIDYRNFVSENNHTTTELVKEATATIVEVKNTIANHNKVSEMMLDELRKKL